MLQQEKMPESPGKSIETARSLLQQETDAGISASAQDAAHFPCQNSRRIPKCLWQREKGPVNTGLVAGQKVSGHQSALCGASQTYRHLPSRHTPTTLCTDLQ